MPSNTIKNRILLLGGTGKISCRLAPLLSTNGNAVILASRSGNVPALPNCHGVHFDWFDESTYNNPFKSTPVISAIFLVAPSIVDQLPIMQRLINLAISNGVRRFVLLSGSVLPVGDGPMMAAVSQYLLTLEVEYAILRPTWFMENFSEAEHYRTIVERDAIVTAAGDGKVPFVSADDIAAVAFKALTDEVSHNTDHLILGPELFSYDEVAEMISLSTGRKITHVRISEDEMADQMHKAGIPEDFSRVLAQLDTYIAGGKEEIMNAVVLNVTGREPIRFEDFLKDCVTKGIWAK